MRIKTSNVTGFAVERHFTHESTRCIEVPCTNLVFLLVYFVRGKSPLGVSGTAAIVQCTSSYSPPE